MDVLLVFTTHDIYLHTSSCVLCLVVTASLTLSTSDVPPQHLRLLLTGEKVSSAASWFSFTASEDPGWLCRQTHCERFIRKTIKLKLKPTRDFEPNLRSETKV